MLVKLGVVDANEKILTNYLIIAYAFRDYKYNKVQNNLYKMKSMVEIKIKLIQNSCPR